MSPLARAHRDDPALVERFEAVVLGRELANAFSELNDPIDQRARFEAQAQLADAGDDEAHGVDEDYVRGARVRHAADCGGLGIGIDRLVMLLAGVSSIREVILFPHLRPEGGRGSTRASRTASEPRLRVLVTGMGGDARDARRAAARSSVTTSRSSSASTSCRRAAGCAEPMFKRIDPARP